MKASNGEYMDPVHRPLPLNVALGAIETPVKLKPERGRPLKLRKRKMWQQSGNAQAAKS